MSFFKRRAARPLSDGPREAEIAKLREQIRVADRSHGYGADESTKKEAEMGRAGSREGTLGEKGYDYMTNIDTTVCTMTQNDDTKRDHKTP